MVQSQRFPWPVLILAAVPRLLGAFFLPNAFGDAYVYIRDIGNWSTKVSTGSFRITDLFGFWLPLYQLVAALLNVFVKNGFYSGKIVSALFGVGACLFVYLITARLTNNKRAAMLIFLLIALNPLHIFYSASAMTDVPHSFFVLGALYFVLVKRWTAAALFAALAGLTRVESWMFIAIIPALQLLRERRVSVTAILIMIVPPLFWFYISWKATGDWLACFRQRQQYLEWLLSMNPAIAQFSMKNVLRDTAALLVSTDIAVTIACFGAGWFVLRQLRGRGLELSSDAHLITPPLVFFFAFLSLLCVAYLTHQQPIIFPRYGLILFILGLPVLAWGFLKLKAHRPGWGRRVLLAIVVICSLDASIQLAGAVGTINQYRSQRALADHLRDNFKLNSTARIFCDEGSVQALSGIPPEKFLSSSGAPTDRDGFIKFINEREVNYLVFIKRADSLPFKLFPDMDANPPARFMLEKQTHSTFLPTDIWLYRVR